MIKKIFVLLALLLVLGVSGDNLSSSRPSAQGLSARRILFRIATIEESKATRNRLSLALVEGPPGTDFDIRLTGSQFTMKAHFLTDLVGPETLKVRARLNTRRLYGYSERNLPLFEEDQQSQTLDMNFDEAVVLFPFGRGSGDQRLKVEITPSWSDAPIEVQGRTQPLTIKIPEVGPEGVVSVHASKTPHRFNVQATLLEDGHEIASGTSEFLIEELQTLRVKPAAGPGAAIADFDLNLTLRNYIGSSAADQIALDFDLRRSSKPVADSMITKGGGIANLNSPLTYNLSESSFGTRKNYQLLIKVSLAEGEKK